MCAIKPCKILIPNTKDKTAFAVIACDQFTSENEYWDKLSNLVKNKQTALDLVLPEIYLNLDDVQKRIDKINSNMESYLKNNAFCELDEGYILTVRKTKYKEKRIGLIGAVDLEEYDFKVGAKKLVRATEGTIEERIPPRLKIRKNAPIEFPHIMILFDDETMSINEMLYKNRDEFSKLYDFELNMDGGHLQGYYIKDTKEIDKKFSHLLDEDRLIKKYGTYDKFLFAVGDGNHSLATAKTHWENLKKTLSESEKLTHPARYALVEFVNIYDDGIYFEPIHRFIFNIDREKFILGLNKLDVNIKIYDGQMTIKASNLSVPNSIKNVDNYIKDYIEKNGGNVDYIHGDDNIEKLVNENKNSIGILFEKLDKKDLFKYVSNNGALPRKTFSMGEGIEKRYYFEGRKIK